MKIYITSLFYMYAFFSFGQNSVTVKLHSIRGYEGYEDFATIAIKKLEQTEEIK